MTCERCGKRLRGEGQKRFCSPGCALVALNAAKSRHGRDNPLYNGGLCIRADGRGVIHCRDGTLLYFYRAVVAARLGRLLGPEEIVHHVNEDVTDDRPENLEIVTRAEHIGIHRGALRRAA